MHRLRLLALALLAFFVAACDRQPTQAPAGEPAAVIRDGTDADGNRDFFFLPPLVPLPINHPNFELGDFNPNVGPSVEVKICELNGNNLDAQRLPTGQTTCGAMKKVFAQGTVKLVKLPLVENGWWRAHNLPDDGFYYVLWDTRPSNLSTSKFYRIHVMLGGVELGIADVDPMGSLREFRNVKTGSVVQIVDDTWLPIPFRIENGALCSGLALCVEKTITNDNPTGDYQVIGLQGPGGLIAGGLFPDGWLPTGTNPDGTPRPQSVVVAIEKVETGANNPLTGYQEKPCHIGTPGAPFALQQFNGCFHFSTIPELVPIDNESPRTFARDVTGAVCISLSGEDPRFAFLQLWKSGRDETPVESPNPLKSVVVTQEILGNTNCQGVYGARPQPGTFAFVSNGLRMLAGGFGRVFGVRQAQAVDLGLGGLLPDFSNIGPALTAEILRYSPAEITVNPGSTALMTARLIGTYFHDARALDRGIPNLPVTFSVAAGNGTLSELGSDGWQGLTVVGPVYTSADAIDVEGPVSGLAQVQWRPPTAPGTYTMRATGQARAAGGGNAVTFTATVPAYGSIAGMVWEGATDVRVLPGTTIQLLAPSGAILATDIANDVTSNFNFQNLPPGTYSVSALAGSHEPQTLPAVVTAGANTRIVFRLARLAGELAGTVTDAITGAPLAGAVINVREAENSVTTSATGEYFMANVPTGTYRLTAQHTGYASLERSVTVTGNTGNTVSDFALTPLPPSIALSPASPLIVSAVAGGATVQRTVTINNAGGGTLQGLAVQFAYPVTLVCDTCTPPRMVSVSLNSDVTPAVVTLSAAVDATIPTSDYSFTFTVSATNASNGPINYPFVVRVGAPITPISPPGGECTIACTVVPPPQ